VSAADDAALVVSLFAVDPAGTGGVCVRSPAHAPRDIWLQMLRETLPRGTPVRRVPSSLPDGRLLGGLDLVATMQANRPVAERGVLAETDGGVIVLAMAERLSTGTAARLNQVLDRGEVDMPREGLTLHHPARIGIVALDEGIADDERLPVSLLDRLAFMVDLSAFDLRTELIPPYEQEDIVAARSLLPDVTVDDAVLQALCATAIALGAGSPRVTRLATHVARIAAALDERRIATEEDAVIAGRLVLAPRATRLPPAEPANEMPPEPPPEPPAESPAEPPPPEPPPADPSTGDPPQSLPEPPLQLDQQMLEDIVLEATRASIPPGLLAQLREGARERASRAQSAGKAGAFRKSGARGRPAGIAASPPRGDARLNIIETLRAAAPWQRLRGRDGARVRVLPEDFRITRYKQRTQTLTIFAVDASGSSALNRLAEAKGAVELLLADCYVRRDQVAVIAFRGRSAELLLPPTRSLVRAKRSLAGLPGGGGTPLATALDTATALAQGSRRRGETPTLVMLTDGRANIARDGAPGRDRAHADALRSASLFAAGGTHALFIDTSPRPADAARMIAARMGARYIALPFVNAASLNAVVRAATAGSRD
jgi:magnesium chelatase subunit D